VRCAYLDLDGTLLGPDSSLLRGADGRFTTLGVRALEACARAGVEVVLYSGRKQSSVFESARLIGSSAYIFELGCGLVLDGELEWLTGGVVPSDDRGTIYAQLEASGAPALLLERYVGRLEYHTPWSIGREVSHLFRGQVDPAEVRSLLDDAGLDWLRLVDNGVAHEHASRFPELPVVHVYHLIPAAASKARAVARHMQARGYSRSECIAVRRAARGAASRSIRRKPGSPVSRCASSTGFAIVALASRKRGSLPWIAAARRRRRSTLATCEPNTPR
jgi:hydroxymethylpyrimidine pyrophosphatase-like HAD family hydrolase